jgi:tetrahydrodipicolinate N-succinyltransferase
VQKRKKILTLSVFVWWNFLNSFSIKFTENDTIYLKRTLECLQEEIWEKKYPKLKEIVYSNTYKEQRKSVRELLKEIDFKSKIRI